MSNRCMRHPMPPLKRALLFVFILFGSTASYAESRSDYFAVGQDKIYFETEGDGFPLVLVSGGSGMDLRQWNLVTPTLAESYTIIRYDPRGTGRSDNPTEIYADTEDLNRLMGFLGIEEAILIGLSSSGGFVLEHAIQFPARVKGAVVAAPFIPGFQFSDAMLARLQVFSVAAEAGREAFLDSMLDDPHFLPAPLNPSARSFARENMGANYDKAAGFDPDLAIQLDPPLIEQLSNITAPVLLLAGSLDHSEVHRRNEFLSTKIPSNRRLQIPDAGHNAPLENPDAFLSAIRPFLEELSNN